MSLEKTNFFLSAMHKFVINSSTSKSFSLMIRIISVKAFDSFPSSTVSVRAYRHFVTTSGVSSAVCVTTIKQFISWYYYL